MILSFPPPSSFSSFSSFSSSLLLLLLLFLLLLLLLLLSFLLLLLLLLLLLHISLNCSEFFLWVSLLIIPELHESLSFSLYKHFLSFESFFVSY